MVGVGLYIEENLQEILSRFHAAVTRELGFDEASLRLAAPILLQEIARSLRRGERRAEPWRRAVLLVVSQPEGGIRGLLREYALLRRSLWETLATRGHAFPSEERRLVDGMLDETLAQSAERWASLVRVLPPSWRRTEDSAGRTVAPSPPRALHPGDRPPPLKPH